MTGRELIVLVSTIVLGSLLLIILLYSFFRRQEKQYPFMPRVLFTPSEHTFYLVLRECVPEGCWLFAKVRLWDVIEVEPETESRGSYTNRIRAKHLDFLLTDESGEPLLAIELDDASHQRADRIQRDIFVDNALYAAGIPILHVPTQNTYDSSFLYEEIIRHMKT